MARREYTEYFHSMDEAVAWEEWFRDKKDRDEHIVLCAHKSNKMVWQDTQEPCYVVKWEKY